MSVFDRLTAIRDHLDRYELPPAAGIDVSTYGRAAVSVHLDCDDRLPPLAADLLAWADTIAQPDASVWRPPAGDTVHVAVRGRLDDGASIRAYASVPYSIGQFPDLPVEVEQRVSLAVVREWSTLGEVAA